jgi:hypothetical protein
LGLPPLEPPNVGLGGGGDFVPEGLLLLPELLPLPFVIYLLFYGLFFCCFCCLYYYRNQKYQYFHFIKPFWSFTPDLTDSKGGFTILVDFID